MKEKIEIFKGADQQVYITDLTSELKTTYKIESPEAYYLVRQLDEFEGLGEKKVQEFIGIEAQKARLDGDSKQVANRYLQKRFGELPIVIDGVTSIIGIFPDGIIQLEKHRSKGRFVYSREKRPLPDVKGCSFEVDDYKRFQELINLEDKGDFLLLTTCIVSAMGRQAEYPILGVFGAAKSAKSTLCKFVQSLIDPTTTELGSQCSNRDDLAVAVSNVHLLTIDNAASLKPQIQDALCQIATGGTYVKRKLHSDSDTVRVDLLTPVLINGISNPLNQEDLASRAITFELPKVKSPKSKQSLLEEFEDALPSIYAGLLELIRRVYLKLPDIQVDESPIRLVDYYRMGIAISEVFGEDEAFFRIALKRNQRRSLVDQIENSVVASIIKEVFDDEGKELRLTYGEFVRKFELKIQPRQLGEELRRLAPALRIVLKISFEELGHKRNGNLFRLKKVKSKKKK